MKRANNVQVDSINQTWTDIPPAFPVRTTPSLVVVQALANVNPDLGKQVSDSSLMNYP